MLGASHLERLTDWTVQQHAARDFNALAEVTLAAAADLVPCDWPMIGLAPDMPGDASLWRSPHRADWDGFKAASLRHATEDPVYTNRLRLLFGGTGAISGFGGTRAFFETALYHEAWRPMGVKWLFSSLNPGVFGYGLKAARSSGDDFTAEENLLLNTLARHMDAATARLVRDHAGQLPVGRQRLPIARCSWFVCDRSGAILRAREDAMDYLRACLGPRVSHSQIPAHWLEEFNRRLAGLTPHPQRYHRAGRSITAYIAPIRGTPEEFSVFFVEETRTIDPQATLVAMGLTAREAEVLRWMAEGKTNPEIGVILGISELTAKKHVENILHKLNVPTRSAAAAAAVERMQTSR